MPAVMAGQFSFKCLNVQDSPSTFLGGKHSGKTLLSLPRVARNSSSMLILPAAWHDLSGKVGDPSSRATYTNMSLWIIMHHMFVSSSLFLKAPHPSSIKDFFTESLYQNICWDLSDLAFDSWPWSRRLLWTANSRLRQTWTDNEKAQIFLQRGVNCLESATSVWHCTRILS